ncbi:MAG: DinB family protein [Anaerolineales bacterium]|nr:MAG: DinB family protein [Anaerolineales bacterium]
MNTVELIHHSLGFAFDVLEQLVSDLTQEQADWMPPGNANPISALYWHTVSYVDQIVHDWGMGHRAPKVNYTQSIRKSAGWQEKVVIACPPVDPEDPMEDLRAIHEGLRVDLAALHDYARATRQALLGWVASLTPEDMARKIETTIGELTVGQFLEAYVIWHINVHCGEIAALKGCQGLKGYPW